MLSPDFSSLRPQDYGLLTDLYQFHHGRLLRGGRARVSARCL
jgi:hypothetical protein